MKTKERSKKVEKKKIEGEVVINGVVYVPKSSAREVKKVDGKYFIVRTYSAGVFAGEIESRKGQEVVMRNVRRLWKWDGACSLSQLAMEGVKKPENCSFSVPVTKETLINAIEIIDVTPEAKMSIQGVKEWKS